MSDDRLPEENAAPDGPGAADRDGDSKSVRAGTPRNNGSGPLSQADFTAAEQQFQQDLRERNIAVRGQLQIGLRPDGSWPRGNAVNKGRSGKGDAQYVFNLYDGWPRWTIINYTDGQGFRSGYYGKADMTPEQRDLRDAAIAQNKEEIAAANKRQEERWEKIAERCRARWERARPADPQHPYLVRKNVRPYGIRQEGENLLVPMIGADDKIWSLQTIPPQPGARKMYTKGGRAGYGVYIIEPSDGIKPSEVSIAFVGEGYATMASVREVTGCAVVVAFDSGKLRLGVERARRRWPNARVILAADDDWRTADNPGITKARQAGADAIAVPDFAGVQRGDRDTDYNDLLRLKGREAVLASLMGATNIVSAGARALALTIRWRDLKDKYGTPAPSLANAVLAIRALGIICKLDLFHQVVLVGIGAREGTDDLNNFIGELTDHTIGAIRSLVNNQYRLDVGDANTVAAILEIARANAFDPILDYLIEVQGRWDGKKRLDTWLIDYCGAPDTPFVRAVGRKHLVASVRRARSPGVKYDDILVMESPEGRNKSTAIELLAGKANFSDQTILGVEDRTAQELVTGVWLYEIADLTDIGKADVNRCKAFVDRRQ
jgi:phage/plasmid primase-like uncharacterized protein